MTGNLNKLKATGRMYGLESKMDVASKSEPHAIAARLSSVLLCVVRLSSSLV